MTTADRRFYGRVMSLSMMASDCRPCWAPFGARWATPSGVRDTLLIVGAVGAAAIGLAFLEWLRIRGRPHTAPIPALLDAPLEPPGPA